MLYVNMERKLLGCTSSGSWLHPTQDGKLQEAWGRARGALGAHNQGGEEVRHVFDVEKCVWGGGTAAKAEDHGCQVHITHAWSSAVLGQPRVTSLNFLASAMS